jgi:hypothetical protein
MLSEINSTASWNRQLHPQSRVFATYRRYSGKKARKKTTN